MGCFSLYYFKKAFGGVGGEKGKMEVGEVMTESEWKDLPMELLLKIVSRVDDQTVITASGVCTWWRDVICLNRTHLCLPWSKNGMNNLLLSLAPKFTNLQELSLCQGESQLQDDAVEAVANFCHDLWYLNLSNSTRLTDRSLYALAHGCPGLTELNISGCTSFGDSALAYLVGCCRNLKTLDLCGCSRAATGRSLEAIGYNCTQLQTLNLALCEQITSVGLTSIAHGCPDLRELDLYGCCRGVTFGGVLSLADGCPHLSKLNLQFCGITDEGLRQLEVLLAVPLGPDGSFLFWF